MARWTASNGAKAGINTANSAMWEIRAITDTLNIVEIGLSIASSPTTGPSWRLNRATAVGTNSATVTPLAEDSGIVTAALWRLDTAWSVQPTAASTDLRVYATPNAIGSGICWTWAPQAPLKVPISGGIIIINGNAAGATLGTMGIYVIADV